MTRRFLKQFKDGGSPFVATVDDIEAVVQSASAGEQTIARTLRKHLSEGHYTEEFPLTTKFSKLWSEGE